MKHNGGTDLSHELKALADEAEALVEQTGEDLTERTKDIRDRLAAALEALEEKVGDIDERAAAGLKQIDKSIRANPYQALAIALGVGLAAGLLLKRK
jgi:ElaB/YqjD/DUF883 family membrane-anchored ribosome-binding protein